MSYTIANRVVAPEAPHQADDVLLPNKKTKELEMAQSAKGILPGM